MGDVGWPLVDAHGARVSALAALLDGSAVDGIFEFRRAGGQVAEMRLRGTALGDGERPVGALLVLSEVPKGLAEQHSLGQVALAYQVLADSLTDVVVASGPAGITWASPSAHQALGFLPEQLVGTRCADWVHPDDVRAPVVTPGAPAAVVLHRMRVAAGDYRWFETAVRGEFDDLGQAVRVFSSSRDVDDRVRLEAELEAVRLRKREALDASPDGFAIYRAERDGSGMVTGLRLQFINATGARVA